MNPTAHQWAVAIVSYYPPLEAAERIQAIQLAGYTAYLWHNSSDQSGLSADVNLNVGGPNLGLGKALGALCERAARDGFSYLLYFDQDTHFTAASLSTIDAFVEGGGFAADYSAIRFGELNPSSPIAPLVRAQPLILSSGTLFRLSSNARHDARFFVEGVDYQYCLDAARKGWKLGFTGCVGIAHESIQPFYQFQLGPWSIRYRPYPLKRHFSFLANLLRLLLLSVLYGQFKYAWLFARNLASHLAVQLQAMALNLFMRMGLAKKAVYL